MCLILLKIYKNHILLNIEVIRNFQMKVLSNQKSPKYIFSIQLKVGKLFSWKLKKTNDITLKKNAPLKKRSVKANQAPFINKTITKEIMKPSRLTNKETFRNTKSEIEKQIKSNGTTALLILEKQNKHSFAILTTLL